MTPPDEIWRRIVPPLVAAFAVFLAMVRALARTPTTAAAPRSAGGRDFVRYLAVTAVGGYVVFLAIVLVFHVVLARDHGALKSAAWGGAALLAIALPVFVVAEWLARRSAR
jgi:Family of unknown function (DUF6256)